MSHITPGKKAIVGGGRMPVARAMEVAGHWTAPMGPQSVLINGGDVVAFQGVEAVVQLQKSRRRAITTCQWEQVFAIVKEEAILVDQVNPARIGDEKILIMIEQVTEDPIAPVDFRPGDGVPEENGEVEELPACIDQGGLFQVSGVEGFDPVAIVSGITIEVVVVGLKIDRTLIVGRQVGDIGFHFRFVSGVVKVKGVAVKTDQAYLGGEPQIPIPVKKEVVDAVLRQAVLICKVLDSIPVSQFGLGEGGCRI